MEIKLLADGFSVTKRTTGASGSQCHAARRDVDQGCRHNVLSWR